MKVTIEVLNCYTCPYFTDGRGYGDDYCNKTQVTIFNALYIPDDCPFRENYSDNNIYLPKEI